MKKLDNKGFGPLGILFIILVVAAVGGTGYYVYHKNYKASPNSNKPTTMTNNGDSASSQATNYFVFKDWDVRAQYAGDLTLTIQSVDTKNAVLSSKQLLDNPDKAGCIGPTSRNFIIERYGPNEYISDNRMNETGNAKTAAQSYADTSSVVKLIKVGEYFYHYRTVKAPCSVATYDQNPYFGKTDEALKMVTSHLEEIPN